MLTDVYIELHVPDFRKAIEFYSRLGFKLLWRTEDYLVMRRKRSVLNFYGGSQKVYSHSYFGRFKQTTKCGYGVELIIPVDRVELFYRSVRKFAKIVQPLQLKKWGHHDRYPRNHIDSVKLQILQLVRIVCQKLDRFYVEGHQHVGRYVVVSLVGPEA